MTWCIVAGVVGVQLRDRLGASIVAVEYPGYGINRSEKASARRVLRDTHAVYDYMVSHAGYDPNNIVMFGRSIGSGVAADVAAKRHVGVSCASRGCVVFKCSGPSPHVLVLVSIRALCACLPRDRDCCHGCVCVSLRLAAAVACGLWLVAGACRCVYFVQGLILLSAYTSINRLVRVLGGRLAACITGERFPTITSVPDITCPVALVHGADDDIIPCTMSDELFAAFKESAPARRVAIDVVPGMVRAVCGADRLILGCRCSHACWYCCVSVLCTQHHNNVSLYWGRRVLPLIMSVFDGTGDTVRLYQRSMPELQQPAQVSIAVAPRSSDGGCAQYTWTWATATSQGAAEESKLAAGGDGSTEGGAGVGVGVEDTSATSGAGVRSADVGVGVGAGIGADAGSRHSGSGDGAGSSDVADVGVVLAGAGAGNAVGAGNVVEGGNVVSGDGSAAGSGGAATKENTAGGAAAGAALPAPASSGCVENATASGDPGVGEGVLGVST